MDLVMMNGHVACLKTTLSYLLAPRLKMGHVTTSVLGPFESNIDDARFFQLRDRRYHLAAEIVEHYLARGVSVMVDGTFALPCWREAIYRAAVRHQLKELVAITCMCSQLDLIVQRLAHRRHSPRAPDARANNIAAYEGSVRTFVPLENDLLPDGRDISHIVFDSGTYKVTVLNASGGLCRHVAHLIAELAASGMLDQPLFTARRRIDTN